MSKPVRELESVDAVIVGGNIRGLVAAHVLSNLGYRAVLLEKADAVGGVDRSFVTPDGTTFDIGLHVLDYERSEVATRLFTHATNGEFHRVKLKRGIVLRNQIMPYAPDPTEMPAELRAMLPSGEIVDDIADDIPTRKRIGEIYGPAFADLVLDEVLPSYRCENRHRKFGVDEGILLRNVYPWLFPRANRTSRSNDESRTFHDKLRNGEEQWVLYPKKGGFGGFADGLREKLSHRIEVLTGVDDVHLEIEAGTHTAKWVGGDGRRFTARHYFWAAPWPLLCRQLDIPCPEIAVDRVLLGSYRLNRSANCDFHELLVGDPDLRFNRVFFPSHFREVDEPLMQVEHAFPRADDEPINADHWREAWLDDCRRLGIIDDNHEVEAFDFKTFCMHFNAYGMDGVPLEEADASKLAAGSNIRPVTPSLFRLNLNSHVPRDISYVTNVLARPPT